MTDDRLAAATRLIEKYGSEQQKDNLQEFFDLGIKAFDPTVEVYQGDMF
jgi:hypothetical protein